jgi:hypothetical protein
MTGERYLHETAYTQPYHYLLQSESQRAEALWYTQTGLRMFKRAEGERIGSE